MLNTSECAQKSMVALAQWICDTVYNNLNGEPLNTLVLGKQDNVLNVYVGMLNKGIRRVFFSSDEDEKEQKDSEIYSHSNHFLIAENSWYECFSTMLNGINLYAKEVKGANISSTSGMITNLNATTKKEMCDSLNKALTGSYNAITAFNKTSSILHNVGSKTAATDLSSQNVQCGVEDEGFSVWKIISVGMLCLSSAVMTCFAASFLYDKFCHSRAPIVTEPDPNVVVYSSPPPPYTALKAPSTSVDGCNLQGGKHDQKYAV